MLERLCSHIPEVADLRLENFSPCYCQEVELIGFASKIGFALYKVRTKTDAERKKKKVILIRGLEPPAPSLACLVYALLQQAAKQTDQSVHAYVYEAVRRRMEQGSTETDTPG